MQGKGKFIAIIFLLFIFACKPDRCLHTTGAIIIEERKPGGFTGITIQDVFSVEIIPDSSDRIELVAGEKLLPFISIINTNQHLTIKNENQCNWLRSFRNRPLLKIYTDSLTHIIVEGEIDLVFTDTLFADSLIYEVWTGLSTADILISTHKFVFSLNGGSGKFTVAGNAGLSYIYAVGAGFVYAGEMPCDYGYITNVSTGDIFVNVTKELIVRLRNSGDVYYSGCPTIVSIAEQSINGRLFNLNE